MDVNGPVESLMNSTPSYVASGHVSIQVEMYWVPAEPEGLTGKRDLCVRNTGLGLMRIIDWGMDKNHGSKLTATDLITKSTEEASLCGKLSYKIYITLYNNSTGLKLNPQHRERC